jgi:hypothetical protein
MSFILPLEPVVMAFIGEPRSGKSVAIKACMNYWNKKRYFKFGICISGSSWNGDYDFLPSKALWDKWDEERFKQYIEALEQQAHKLHEKGKKLKPSFVILDDLLGQIANSDFFKSFLARFRQWNITLLLAAQYAAESKGCGTMLRSVCDISFMFPSMMFNQVNAMKNAWGGWYKSFDEFQAALVAVKQRDHACLLFQKKMKTKEEAYISLLVKPAPEFKMKF